MTEIDGGLRKIVHGRLRQVHWQAIETGGVGSGVPDSNACHAGVDFWVEHKRTNHWKVEIRPAQIGWIDRRTRAGGVVWILVRQTRGLDDDLWLFAGGVVRELAAEGLKCARERQRWRGGPSRWNLEEMLRIMTYRETTATASVVLRRPDTL